MTPQLVQEPPEKLTAKDPPLVSVVFRVVPEIRYTSVLSAVHTVVPVNGFDAQEFATLGVGITAEVVLFSMPTTATPVDVAGSQFPLGTYETTVVPVTRTDNELDGWQEPGGGATAAACTLKLSVLESDGLKLMTLLSTSEIEVDLVWAINHALYSSPAFGVDENGAIRTGSVPFAGLNVSF